MTRHKAAVYALRKYGFEHETITDAEKLWKSLTWSQKMQCREAVNDIMAAPDEEPEINSLLA